MSTLLVAVETDAGTLERGQNQIAICESSKSVANTPPPEDAKPGP